MTATEAAILVVEDDPDDAEMTLRALRRRKLANPIVHLTDGAAALEYLLGDPAPVPGVSSEVAGAAPAEPRALPMVVLLDLKLPKVGGLDLLRRLRADDRTRLLPVVILTSSDEDQDLLRSYQFGANSYVRKPVEFDRFMDAVGELGLYWAVINRIAPERAR
jgi:two-component system, response regulator